MKKQQDIFVQTLQSFAQRQSKLQNTSVFPPIFNPVTTMIGQYPWQSLLVLSFFTSWVVFLIWFEFFFNFVHNII